MSWVRPCLRAFWLERSLPSLVLGPVFGGELRGEKGSSSVLRLLTGRGGLPSAGIWVWLFVWTRQAPFVYESRRRGELWGSEMAGNGKKGKGEINFVWAVTV